MEYTIAFLSTISQASAAMVAIIGGFLVSRLVALSSEREGLLRQLHAENVTLSSALKRYKRVHGDRLSDSIERFYGWVIDDMVVNKGDLGKLPALIDQNIPRGSSVTELNNYATSLAKRVESAWDILTELVDNGDTRDLDIDELLSRVSTIPKEDKDIFERVGCEIIHKLPSANIFDTAMVNVAGLVNTSTDITDMRRMDETISEEESLSNLVDTAKKNIVHIKKSLEYLGRPNGVIGCVFVLSYLSIVGIALPVIIMSFKPRELGNLWQIVLLAAFLTGVAAVILYIVWYFKSLDDSWE